MTAIPTAGPFIAAINGLENSMYVSVYFLKKGTTALKQMSFKSNFSGTNLNKERPINKLHAKTAFTRCRHILKTVKNSTDRPPVHTEMAHFLPADFENGRF